MKLKNLVIIVLLLLFIIMSFLNQKNVVAQPAGWSNDIRLTNAPLTSGYPCIAIDGDNIYVVWDDERNGSAYDDYEIYFKKSTDNGKTWTIDKRLSNALHYSIFPKICVDGTNIHVVWLDDRIGGTSIYYNQSEDSGESWLGEKRISPDPSISECGAPDIGVDNGYVHTVYPDDSDDPGSDDELYYINSSDNGITWSPRQRLTPLTSCSQYPAIAINGSNIHIVWMEGILGKTFYINSSDNGLTWSKINNLTNLSHSYYPDIAINGDNIHVAFESDEINGFDQVCYRRSEDGGITWTEEVKLSNSTTDTFQPAIALNGSHIYVVWTDERDGNREVYYKYSHDNGKNWSEDIRLTYYIFNKSVTVDIAVNNNIHIVWGDDRDGNFEIYYKYYPFYHPPTNLTIDIWGTNLNLNWTTPQTGLSPLDYYLIYRVTDPEAFTFSDSEIIYNSSLNPGYELDTTWNDSTALLDESNNYYYVVRAVYENGEIDTNENIVGKFVIPLNKGWNLFSIPLAQKDASISQVLKSIDGQYNVVQLYDAKNGIWRSSPTDLSNINRTMGLWIHMKNKRNLSVVGALPESTDIALYEGWNLVGYPSLKTRNLIEALSGITWQAVQHYNAFDSNDPWKHNSTKKPNSMNDLMEMQPGRGYWVYVTINDTWVRTRVGEDNKIVVWEVYGLEKKESYQYNYEPLANNPIDTDEKNYDSPEVVLEKPINRNEDDRVNPSFIPLIILIAFVFAEIILLHKRQR